MKKSLTFIFVLLLSLCFASLTVGAKTGLVEGVEDGKDYYVVDGTQVVLDLQFDGEGVWGDKNGLYVPGAQTVEADGYLVYSGAASWTQYMIVKPNDEYKNSVLTVTVVAELDGISDFYACARQSYGNNGRPDILREPGIMNATYTDGKLTSFDTRNGWLGASDDKSSDSYTINEKGQLVFQFQVITAGSGLAEIGFEVYDSVDQNGTVKIDSLVITKSNMQTVYENGFDTDGAWGDKEGIYAPNSTVEAGHLVYNGVADYTEFMSLKSDAVYTNSVLFVDMAVELVGVDQFMMTARQGWANAAPDIIREVGIKWPQYDENGKLTAVTAREGWLGKSDDYSLDTYTVDENGILHIHFVVKTGELGLVAMPFQVVGLGGANATVKIDYIKVQKAVAAGKKYYTLAWDTGFEDADLTLNAWDVQPIWGNEPVQFETEYALDGSVCIRLDGTATTQYAWGDALGGFDTVNPEKALLKSTGLHYIQMDIDSTDFAWFNIWTGADDYYEIKYTLGSGWSTVGKVQNFKAVDLGTCWRISWYCDYTNMNVNHGINAYDGTGSIYIDNLIVAYVDNAPFATNSTYNLVGTEDVVLDVNFKEQTLVALNDSEGNAIDASLYAIENNQLTLKKELFASCEASYVFNLVSTGGARQITIKQNDNRVHITGVSATISKVYDGTTSIDASGVAYVLAGVAEGDEVTLTAELAFADKNVGTEKEITVTNVQLSGADAGKYVLPETVTLTGSITPKELTVEFETTGLSKVYDGTTSAQVAIKALNGVVEGDEVAAQLTAEYNSANVDASQINVTLSLTGAQKDNYTIANATIEEGVAITPKSITVVANAQTKEEEAQDPELTYTVTGLVGTDALTGELARNAGEAAGEYDITLGTLSAGDNYTIEFTGAKLTITEKVVTPDPDPEPNPDPDPNPNPDPEPNPNPNPDPEPGTDEGCKLFGYELVMQLVLFLSVLATALYFVRKR